MAFSVLNANQDSRIFSSKSGKQATREKAIRWKVEGAIILRVGFMKMSFGEKLHLKVLEAAAEVFV